MATKTKSSSKSKKIPAKKSSSKSTKSVIVKKTVKKAKKLVEPKKVDYYPNRMTVAISVLAVTLLVLVSLIAVIGAQ